MRVFTKEEAHELGKGETLDTFVANLSCQLQLVKGACSIPVESGRQTALSKLLAYYLFKDIDACIYVTAWGIATEHLDLFYGYRKSFHERRPLIEAPVHLFGPAEAEALVSVLCVAFYFFWDVWVFDLDGKSVLRMSHDGWFEIRCNDVIAANEVDAALQKFGIRPLGQS